MDLVYRWAPRAANHWTWDPPNLDRSLCPAPTGRSSHAPIGTAALDPEPLLQLATPDSDDEDRYANLLVLDRRKCLLLTHAGTLFTIFETNVSNDFTVFRSGEPQIAVNPTDRDNLLMVCTEFGIE